MKEKIDAKVANEALNEAMIERANEAVIEAVIEAANEVMNAAPIVYADTKTEKIPHMRDREATTSPWFTHTELIQRPGKPHIYFILPLYNPPFLFKSKRLIF